MNHVKYRRIREIKAMPVWRRTYIRAVCWALGHKLEPHPLWPDDWLHCKRCPYECSR